MLACFDVLEQHVASLCYFLWRSGDNKDKRHGYPDAVGGCERVDCGDDPSEDEGNSYLGVGDNARIANAVVDVDIPIDSNDNRTEDRVEDGEGPETNLSLAHNRSTLQRSGAAVPKSAKLHLTKLYKWKNHVG